MPQGPIFKQNHPGCVFYPGNGEGDRKEWHHFQPQKINYFSPRDKKQFLSGHCRIFSDVLCLRLRLFLGHFHAGKIIYLLPNFFFIPTYCPVTLLLILFHVS